jgi:hypothetical protein
MGTAVCAQIEQADPGQIGAAGDSADWGYPETTAWYAGRLGIAARRQALPPGTGAEARSLKYSVSTLVNSTSRLTVALAKARRPEDWLGGPIGGGIDHSAKEIGGRLGIPGEDAGGGALELGLRAECGILGPLDDAGVLVGGAGIGSAVEEGVGLGQQGRITQGRPGKALDEILETGGCLEPSPVLGEGIVVSARLWWFSRTSAAPRPRDKAKWRGRGGAWVRAVAELPCRQGGARPPGAPAGRVPVGPEARQEKTRDASPPSSQPDASESSVGFEGAHGRELASSAPAFFSTFRYPDLASSRRPRLSGSRRGRWRSSPSPEIL